ncbi:hypothetical protein CI105_04950 [Candidatus Izimaplasma bacterium ZiA1]|uniref:glycogen synthase n=1 Tax=Candidatus Izimoplasma sp. ZiA1 TaxID=2024899 RepID=UPI000BAA49F0|nr:hypothetical protein CI105_04950 [Candidatus Izimaplasma bacterium ZiA1]
MNVLFVGSEAIPYAKTGCLADVLGSLPKALGNRNIDVSLVLPLHGIIKQDVEKNIRLISSYDIEIGSRVEKINLFSLFKDGVCIYFIDNHNYFGNRDTLYGHHDDGERYYFFNKAIIKSLSYFYSYPDIIHLNDWQSGFVPYLLRKNNIKIKTLFTIHNLTFQGIFPIELMEYLKEEINDVFILNDQVNFLKTGIMLSDFVTTVSKTYSTEILSAEYGYGLNNILNQKKDKLSGIINGIDYDYYNPKTDEDIYFNFTLNNYVKGKRINKEKLLEEFNIIKQRGPLVSIISRINDIKGFDLLKEIIEELITTYKINFILLGYGDSSTELFFEELHNKYPKSVGVFIGYNEILAKKIYAGSDIFLMPSRFEPCGLSQLISYRYGTIPLVRNTGGLKDTVEPLDFFSLNGDGFMFNNYTAKDLMNKIVEAIKIYKQKDIWNRLIKRGLKNDFSWNNSAISYEKLYRKLIENK